MIFELKNKPEIVFLEKLKTQQRPSKFTSKKKEEGSNIRSF